MECNKPKVLILLAMYNGEPWINEQIESILKQQDVTISIIVSDDNSTDDSKSIVSRIMKSNNNVSMITRLNSSGSSGQNFFYLIRKCNIDNYDYIAFSDQDDIWLENKLCTGIELLENNNACGYSSSTMAFWKSGKEKLITQSDKIRDLDFLFEGAGQGCTFILKRDFFSHVQKFCNDNKSITEKFFYHDWLVYILARSKENRWFFDSKSYIRYRQHESNDTGARGTATAVIRRLNLISNGWYKSQIKVALEISKLTSKTNANLEDFEKIFNSKISFSRRLKLVSFFIIKGRRKIIDRLILVISSFLGWV